MWERENRSSGYSGDAMTKDDLVQATAEETLSPNGQLHAAKPKGTESLLLKWGTLKGWTLNTDKSRDILRRWVAIGMCESAMMHHDTPEQIQLICDLIDAIDGDIEHDWTGETMSKEAAKEYIRTYRS
jgi:hypothetical protein